MKTGEERKEYWDSKYYEYWKARVEESGNENSNSQIVQGDAKTEDDNIYLEIFETHPFNPGNLLEVGCAWGRMFYIFKKYGLKIYGIDISKAMIDQARLSFSGDNQIIDVQECEAEKVPHPDNFFDNVVCLATFDATFQEDSLKEFLRVLKIGGKLYFTGKNTLYHENDQLALDAEIGARKKGHPNSFTNVSGMIEMLKRNGHSLQAGYYFHKRGDFGNSQFDTEMPGKFYEWLLIIQKGSNKTQFDKFSSEFSQTFKASDKNN